jgi:3-oxoacyl-[acyl-carrier protein] reductase
MDLGLQGKVVLVAAASQGLGKAVAQQFVAEKATVYICARNQATLEKTAQAIGTKTMVCDLSQPAAVDALVQQIGKVDVLVTNAGGPKPGYFTTIDDNDWQAAFNLTFMSAVRLIRAVLPVMQQQHWGRIICMTSTSVKQPLDNLITSNALRAAVTNLAKTLSLQVAKDGVTVNTVAPGMFETDRLTQLIQKRAEQSGYMFAEERDRLQRTIPAGRFGSVEEFAATVVFLASERASYINGVLLSVDGGITKSY